MCFTALFAFGFESLPMLGWLAAAAAPWLIHLLSRRKYRETAWAAMDFLLAAVKRRTRRIRIEQWLLLLLRTLVIVALVTAVAEPYFEHVLPVFGSNGSTHHVLVIDSSFSMAYKSTDRTRFDEAKRWATQIVEQSPRGDGFTLVQMASPPRVIVATPGLDKEPVCQEIENLGLLHTGADLAATLGEIRKVLDTAHRDTPRLTRHEVCFFTDLQRGTWMPATKGAEASIRIQAAEVASIAQLQVLNLGQAGDDNLAITSLDVSEPRIRVGQTVPLEASVRDFGHLARQHQAVELLVDGQAAGRQYIDIPAEGSAAVHFSHRFASAGDHSVEARLVGDPLKGSSFRGSADALDIDNHRYLAVKVRHALRVLCIDGRPAGDATKSAVFNLVLALSSRSDPSIRSIDLDVATENAVLERDLKNYDCVMLCDVAQFTPSEARILDNYLIHGGGLVFFLGNQVIANNYNRLLADASRPILPARLVAVAKNPGDRLDPRDYQHPIVQKFRNQENAGLLQSPIDQYFKVKPLETVSRRQGAATGAVAAERAAVDGEESNRQPVSHPGAEVALAISNGDPLILTQSIRRGRVVLVTTSADNSWSPLPLWGTYEPLVKEILAWCTASQTQGQNIQVGDPLEGAVATTTGLMEVSIERPSGQRRRVPLEIQGDYNAWRYDDTFTSGFYTAQFGSSLPSSQLFAVNLPAAESDLTPISPEELQNEAWPGIPIDYETAWQAADKPMMSPAGPARRLHVGILYAVVVLLVVETLLARRFGYNAK
jgi:hypothetical protein